jgi:hypothetical protein
MKFCLAESSWEVVEEALGSDHIAILINIFITENRKKEIGLGLKTRGKW